MKPPHFSINEHGEPCLDGVPLPCVTEYHLVVPERSEGFPTLTVKMIVSTKLPSGPPIRQHIDDGHGNRLDVTSLTGETT